MAVTVCEKCGGSGWRIVERGGVSGAEPCDCVPRETTPTTAGLETAANIPPRYSQASLDNFLVGWAPGHERQFQEILLKVRGYIKEFPFGLTKPGLMLVGTTGTGKTHLAVAVLRGLIGKGIECLFYDYMELLGRIRSGYDESAKAADRAAYQSCLDVPVLLIDDLGSHRVRDWIEDTITGIITHRCNQKLPVIVTTNLPDPDVGFNVMRRSASGQTEYQITLEEKIGPRARSRLFEMCEVIRMPACGDYRLREIK